MDFAGLSDEHGAQHTVAWHKSDIASNRRPRGPHTVRSGITNTSAVGVDHFAAASEQADHLQAAYFLSVLTQSRRINDHRIDKYQRGIAASVADGDMERAAGFRRLLRIEERDRQALERMIQNLNRRFPSGTSDEAGSLARKAPLTVR
jgi:hypothetical protein